MNPLEFARLELISPLPSEHALDALSELLRSGEEVEGRRYRLFGWRRGRFFSMSLGMPFLGGSQPVLRAWSSDSIVGPTRFAVIVGARAEVVVVAWFWFLLTVLGAGTRLVLEASDLAAGRSSAGELAVLVPGLGIMLGLLALALWVFRRRGARNAQFLLELFRRTVGAPTPGDAAAPQPIH